MQDRQRDPGAGSFSKVFSRPLLFSKFFQGCFGVVADSLAQPHIALILNTKLVSFGGKKKAECSARNRAFFSLRKSDKKDSRVLGSNLQAFPLLFSKKVATLYSSASEFLYTFFRRYLTNMPSEMYYVTP